MIRIKSTIKTKRIAHGRYCASMPHSNGPKPKPSIFTLLAIVEALPFLSSAAKLTIVVVAVLVKSPADSQEITRPASNKPTMVANKNTSALIADKITPAIST